MIWQPGKSLYGNRYIIQRKLGGGGFGITYLAKNKKGEFVVIKTLKDEVLSNPELSQFRDKYLRDFEREATRLAICRHPHIVQIDNAFYDGLFPCIAMEYIEGDDLWKRVRNGSCLSEAEAVRYIRQIGEALTVVHDKGLLHRDLKPHNIMVRSPRTPLNKGGKEGETPLIKGGKEGVTPLYQRGGEAVLIDFGIAREFVPDVTQHHTSHFLTHGFAPVEQYDEEAHRGEYTDVYALAATLYCLVSGKVPPPAFMRMVRDALVVPKNVSDGVSQAIIKGMALQPENRPQSVQEWLGIFDFDSDDLSSDKGIDYGKLRDLLKAGSWKEADEETARVMLKVAGREEEGWLDIPDIENFPCTDLGTIDRLWVKYSKGRFGFSVQKRIWESVGGKPGEYDYETYKKFGEKVGWYVKEKDYWKYWSDLTFSRNAPGGHLPSWSPLLGGGWVVLCFGVVFDGADLFSRVETCKL